MCVENKQEEYLQTINGVRLFVGDKIFYNGKFILRVERNEKGKWYATDGVNYLAEDGLVCRTSKNGNIYDNPFDEPMMLDFCKDILPNIKRFAVQKKPNN